jgi:glycosyltransferase involved in cell wall biosynthesis
MGGDVLFDEQGKRPEMSRWLTKRLLREAELVTSKSEYLTSVLHDLSVNDNKIMKVYWGVDLQRFRPVEAEGLREKLALSPSDPVILSPRILQRIYNIHLIIGVMPLILKSYSNAKLIVTEYLADPNYKAELVRMVDRLRLNEAVRFIGSVDNADMPMYYSLANVAVGIPSSDGLPQSLFEAMACGVPNVVTALPRYEEVVTHMESAYFVELSHRSIAEGILRVMGDGHLRQRMIDEGIRIAREKADFWKDLRRVEARFYQLRNRPKERKRNLARHVLIIVNLIALILFSLNRRLRGD